VWTGVTRDTRPTADIQSRYFRESDASDGFVPNML